MNIKFCPRCKEIKELEHYNRNKSKKDGLSIYCKPCDNTYSHEYWIKNRDKLTKYNKNKNRNLKKEIIKEYGSMCVCCEETQFEFLTIDHINGGGRKHNDEVGRGQVFYHFLKKNNYPKNIYRILCFNCNCSIGCYGYCPHKGEKIK